MSSTNNGRARLFRGFLLLLLAAPAGHALAQAGPGTTSLRPPLDTLHAAPQRTPHGVRYVFRELGTGPLPKHGQRVSARYAGFLPDGHLFDASEAQGGLLKFRVGRHEVITGLDEVIPLLPVGSRVWVWIPAALGYAANGVRNPDDDKQYLVPPNTPLVFELEIVGVR
ncbi:FKBP-type peptidyl-prolyl cis-trans isomerase [Hymenobacter sp. DH14]|uniref:Peptidyl-prolyl cis-trans isomerase n=1 Tax=Hymenobacter cyanobacteriorum TaxID=2926463 RepID=A0A9X1VNB0_9BACT|nr:FKBP-type peptidyl-prolyl cis-trans isomerase [Hymenobacter cyanobacteriorum]MCI1189296.1 FKBP-type peptidyl-prolyl cis-trans isomerase [Hymenobacter cyanobacteriorum]